MDPKHLMCHYFRILKLFTHSKKDVMNYSQLEIFGLQFGGPLYLSLSFGMELELEIHGIFSGITMPRLKVAKFILTESINIMTSTHSLGT